ncbi:hypothetical protein AAFC00_001974 [Neodothiora populina]|uniref:Protein kinase domain-containing protein n=1 Tax=Neodothiora populina TaxID=2781224 RepID=A0ABR3PR16_9PEZI
MSYVRKKSGETNNLNNDVESSKISWSSFRKLMQEDQAGMALIAHQNQADFRIVAIKTRGVGSEQYNENSRLTSYKNLVNLQSFFEHEGSMNFVYESCSVSLADIQASPYGLLQEYEIAAVCKELLEGLGYISELLRVGHTLRCETILVTEDGYPKIANIGDIMLDSHNLECLESSRLLGYLLKYLLEPVSVLDANHKLELSSHNVWSSDAEDFLLQT